MDAKTCTLGPIPLSSAGVCELSYETGFPFAVVKVVTRCREGIRVVAPLIVTNMEAPDTLYSKRQICMNAAVPGIMTTRIRGNPNAAKLTRYLMMC